MLMQLRLKGFSQVDNGLLNQFRANVPGYTGFDGKRTDVAV
jgi:LPS-assembly protein